MALPKIGETISVEEFNALPSIGETISAEQFTALPEVEIEKKPSLFRRIGERLTERTEKVESIADLMAERKQDLPESIFQTVGQAVGGLGDIGFEVARSVGGALLPDVVGKKFGEAGSFILQTDIGKAGLEAAQKGIEFYESWKLNNPRAARNLEAAVNISSVIPAVKGVGIATKTVAPQLGKGAIVAAKGLEKGLEKTAFKEALQVTSPKLTIEERRLAIKSGRVQKKGLAFLGVHEPIPSKFDEDVARSVQDVVSKQKDFTENVNNIRGKISRESEIVGEQLRQFDQVQPIDIKIPITSRLSSKLKVSREDSKVIFGTDRSLQNNYDSVVKEFMDIYEKQRKIYGQGDIMNLWDARKKFDNIIEEKFPRVFDRLDATDNIRANAILDVRRSVNDFISETLPEGNPFKEQMKNLSHMYKAISNISNKAESLIGKPAVQRLMSLLRKNVVVYGLTGGILTFGAFTGLFSNPLFIGSLILAGTVKIGQKTVTSKMIRNQLKRFLEIAGRNLSISDKRVLKETIDLFPPEK